MPRQAHSRWPVLIVMCVGYFLVLLDVTIVNVALPHIGSSLGSSVSGLQWVVDGYAIALASAMLAGGTFGDLHGHRRVVLAGLVVFGLGSLGCGLAPSVAFLVGARVVQGLGAALLLPGTLAIIAQAFPDDAERARAIGIWAGIGSAALPAGPLLGGALVDGIGWRSVFFLNLPIVAAAGLVAARIVRESRPETGRRLDLAGTVLGGLLLATITFAFIDAGRSGLGAPVIAAALAALGLLIAFLAVESGRRDPTLPLSLFRRPGFSIANSAAGTMNLVTLGLLFVLTLYLQQVQGRSPLGAGLAMLPLFLPLACLAPLTGRLVARIGAKLPMIAGLLVSALGVLLLLRLQSDTAYPLLLAAMLPWGIGMAILTPAVVAAAVAAVPSERSGLASAVNNTARQAGGAIGIAAFGALAGSPGDQGEFLSGFHLAALIGACLWIAMAVGCLLLVPVAARPGSRRGGARRLRLIEET